ncbi:MAG TPA: SelB C-terminal domain-containing protein, partial [Vicinamibacterales bacterium]
IPREELRALTFRRGHESVFGHALNQLARAGTIQLRDRVGLTDRRPSLSIEEAGARDAVEAALQRAGLAPQDLSALAVALGLRLDLAERVARILQRQQSIVRIGELWFHRDALSHLKADIVAMKRPGVETRIDVAAFKERYGLTRKFAIPLLEYLDRERVTRRSGDSRIVL